MPDALPPSAPAAGGAAAAPPAAAADDLAAEAAAAAAAAASEAFAPDDDAHSGRLSAAELAAGAHAPLRYDYARDGESLPGLPARHDLITQGAGRELHASVLNDVARRAEVLFHPTDVHEGTRYANGAAHYELTVYGVTADGSKAQVALRGVPVYFDAWVPAAQRARAGEFAGALAGIMQQHGLARFELGEAYPLKGYAPAPHPYVRLHFHGLKARREAIAFARTGVDEGGPGLQTASDDRSSYYALVARTHGLPLTSWWALADYTYEQGGAACGCRVAPAGGGPERAPLAGYAAHPNAPLCAHAFTVPIGSVRALVHPLRPDPAAEARIAESPALTRDSTLIMTLDIETHSPDKGLGTPPTASKPSDVVFMVCCTLHRLHDAAPLAQVCLTTQDAAPDRRWTTVVCGRGGSPGGARENAQHGQDSLLMALALVWRAWAPDLYVGFNNGQYDDPFLVEKARQLRLLAPMVRLMSALPWRTTTDESVLKYQYTVDRTVKISAEKRLAVSFLKVVGCVPLDARVAYMRIYPKAEKSSLNFFLAKVRLGGKADMPYTRMWRIYERAVALADAGAASAESAEEMRQVAHYCVVDALRCQQLLVKRNVLGEYREVGSLSFTSLLDCVYRAGGHKVCNLLMAYGQLSSELLGRPILGSMVAEPVEMEGKYPGAYVVPPEKGLEEDSPVTGLDFASLYPSLIMAYNLSLDRMLLGPDAEAAAAALEAEGREIHRVVVPFGNAVVRGWFVRHQGVARERGIFARALEDLYGKRAVLKKTTKRLEALIEWMEGVAAAHRKAHPGNPDAFGVALADALAAACVELDGSVAAAQDSARAAVAEQDARAAAGDAAAATAAGARAGTLRARAALLARVLEDAAPIVALAGRGPDTFGAFAQALDDAEFRFAAIDTKQKAVKLFMNTFYGEAGNKLSPIFALELAAGVTSAGQYNLRLVAEHVLSKGFVIKYGDTDSLYLACPAKHYAAAEAQYFAGLRALGLWVPPGVEGVDAPARRCADDAAFRAAYPAWWAAEQQRCRCSLAEADAWLAARAGLPEFGGDAAQARLRGVHARVAGPARAALAALGEGPRPFAPGSWLREQLAAADADAAAGAALRARVAELYYALCVEKVAVAMRVMGVIRDDVNAMLRRDNGTGHLSMAYEEVLAPVVFTGKKKYFGVAHVNRPSFDIADASKIFVRGIDVVKQGQTRLAKEVGYRCMWRATRLCPPGDREPLIARVEGVLRASCSGMDSFRAGDACVGWDLADFVQSDAWKPNKDNRSVQKFMARMRARHRLQLSENEERAARGAAPLPLDYVEPEAGERFSYLIVDAGQAFSLMGFAEGNTNKGSLMEYVHVAERRRMRVNVPYYLIHYVVGLCARFINYDERFQPPHPELLPSKDIDKFAQGRAKTYLAAFVRGLNPDSRGSAQRRGRAYKRAYGRAAGAAAAALDAALGPGADMFNGGAAGLVVRRDESAMTPEERAGRGLVSFELFLAPEGDAPPLAERVRAAAARFGEWVSEQAELPAPAVVRGAGGAALARGAGECRSAAAVAALGVSAEPAGRRRLYRLLDVLQEPARRRGRAGEHPCAAEGRLLAAVERRAYAAVDAAAGVLEQVSERVEGSLEELVAAERAREHRLHPGELDDGAEEAAPGAGPGAPEDAEEAGAGAGEECAFSAGQLARLFECSAAERAAVASVRAAWMQMVGVAALRAARRRLVAALVLERDRRL